MKLFNKNKPTKRGYKCGFAQEIVKGTKHLSLELERGFWTVHYLDSSTNTKRLKTFVSKKQADLYYKNLQFLFALNSY